MSCTETMIYSHPMATYHPMVPSHTTLQRVVWSSMGTPYRGMACMQLRSSTPCTILLCL